MSDSNNKPFQALNFYHKDTLSPKKQHGGLLGSTERYFEMRHGNFNQNFDKARNSPRKENLLTKNLVVSVHNLNVSDTTVHLEKNGTGILSSPKKEIFQSPSKPDKIKVFSPLKKNIVPVKDIMHKSSDNISRLSIGISDTIGNCKSCSSMTQNLIPNENNSASKEICSVAKKKIISNNFLPNKIYEKGSDDNFSESLRKKSKVNTITAEIIKKTNKQRSTGEEVSDNVKDNSSVKSCKENLTVNQNKDLAEPLTSRSSNRRKSSRILSPSSNMQKKSATVIDFSYKKKSRRKKSSCIGLEKKKNKKKRKDLSESDEEYAESSSSSSEDDYCSESDESFTGKSTAKTLRKSKKLVKKKVENSSNVSDTGNLFEDIKNDGEFEPLHFLRCHSGELENLKSATTKCDPKDCKTKVWSCQFEPDPDILGQTRGIVATCGGNAVCIIDCATGRVLKRFKQGREVFYAIAWSTVMLPQEEGGHLTNILAVGGHNAHVKLLWPDQGICYAEFGNGRPHRSVSDYYINCLAFHPIAKTLLFAGASDETISVFNIELPSQFKTNSERELQVLISPCGALIRLAFNAQSSYLIAACSEGVCVWPLPDSISEYNKKIRPKGIEVSIAGLEDKQVDGLSRLEQNIFALKATSVANIFICRFPDHLPKGKSERIQVEVLKQLQWAVTDFDYIDLTASSGRVACGDDKGSIWLYEEFLKKTNSKHKQPLYKELLWPQCTIGSNRWEDQQMTDVLEDNKDIVCNCVAMDTKGRFLVAGTDNNLVCIWQRVHLLNKR